MRLGQFQEIVRERAVLVYYVLAFGISWGSLIVAMGGPAGFPARAGEVQSLMPKAIVALLAGPTVAGLLMIGLTRGRAGFRDLMRRLIAVRIGAQGYAFILFLAPLAMLLPPLAASAVWPQFVPRVFMAPDKAAILAFGLGAGLSAGLFEEIGWTGFAVPGLIRRYRGLTPGLMAGVLWGVWHIPVNIWSSGDAAGRLAPDLFLHSLAYSAAVLPAFRILMVRVYDRTGSVWAAILMHLSLTGGNIILVPAALRGLSAPAWSLMVALPLWAAVAVLARRTSTPPVESRPGPDK